jgi:hypothetical protein
VERTRGGRSAIELPRSVDSHCDLAAALALGVWEIEAKGTPRPARRHSPFLNGGGGVRRRGSEAERWSWPLPASIASRILLPGEFGR